MKTPKVIDWGTIYKCSAYINLDPYDFHTLVTGYFYGTEAVLPSSEKDLRHTRVL